MRDDVQIDKFNNKEMSIQIYQCQQTYRERVQKLLSDYLINNGNQRLLKTLKIMNNSSQQQCQQSSLPNYYQRFINQFTKIIHENHTFLKSIKHNDNYLKLIYNDDQSQKLSMLVKSYESKIINQLITFMRKNSLLQTIKNSKLQQIAKSYQIIQLPKKQSIQFRNNQQQIMNMYYLLQGDIQKIRYYSFNQKDNKIPKNNHQFSLKNTIQQVKMNKFQSNHNQTNNKNQSKLQKKIIINQSELSKKKQNHNKAVSQLNPQINNNNTNKYSLKSILTKRKSLSRNTLKTLIQSGQFIGDQFFSNTSNNYHQFPIMTKFLVISQKAILIRFSGQLINQILHQYNYHQNSNSFYHQKSSIQLQQIHSMRLFDKKYKSLCMKNQQNQLKKQCSPEIQQMKKLVLKRYLTSNSQSQVDSNSPKQLFKILTKRKKKMNINRKNNFQLPVVQVFSTHSQKRRSHQNAALSPIAIVKTNKNNSLLNKPDNILENGQKCQIYQIKKWQSSAQLGEDKIPSSMRQLQQITKQKRRPCGGFQLLQLERVLQKIKVNLKKK